MAMFLQLAKLAEVLTATSSKLKKRAAIVESLLAVLAESGDVEAGLFALYLAGTPFAEADPRKVSAGGAMLSSVIKDVSGASDAQLTAAYRRHGDLGAAAHDVFLDANRSAVGSAATGITLPDVAEALAHSASAKTTAIRKGVLKALLERASALEAKYLIKLISGDMRIGVKQSLVEEAIAAAAGRHVADVRHAVMLEADLARATAMAFEDTLHEARMHLFHPLGFMLASPVETPEEAIERFSETPSKKPKDADTDVAEDVQQAEETQAATSPSAVNAQVEDKYDGMRVQLHCGDTDQPGRVALYSRNREDVTDSYPEIVEAFAEVIDRPFILDGELLAWDIAQDRALPFAVLSPRIGRKRVDNTIRKSTPVVFMAFDLLFADGALQLDRPLRERRARLEEISAELQERTTSPLEMAAKADVRLFARADTQAEQVQRLRLAPVFTAHAADDLDRAYTDARARGNEGVMIKAADSLYMPGRRGIAWVKLKRTLDTLDVVITGAEFGSGRRSQLLSDYTFAVRGPDGDLLNVGKAYSGVTDAEIAELTEWLKGHTLEDFGHFRTVEPLRVLEVSFNNVMRSDRHASGFALRFPRIVRVRDDKPVEEIDTLERVEEIYQSQPDKAGE